MRGTRLLVRGATFFTPSGATTTHVADILVDDGRIGAITATPIVQPRGPLHGPTRVDNGDDGRSQYDPNNNGAQYPQTDQEPCDNIRVLDARGLIALPGLVNAHHNLGNQRRRPRDHSGTSYADAVARSTKAMVAMLKAGTTTACFMARDHPDAVAEAAVRVGMRAIVAPVMNDRTARGDPMSAASDDVERVVGLARRWRPYPAVTVAVGLADISTYRQAYLGGVVWTARRRGLCVHARIDDSNVAHLASVALGARPGTFSLAVCSAPLDRVGLCAATVAGMGVVYGDDVEPAIPSRRSTQSLAPMALGADAGDLFRRMRSVLSSNSYTGTVDQILAMATTDGGRVLGLDPCGVGALRVGGVADMILVDPRRFGCSLSKGTADHLIASVVRYCRPDDVSCVIVDGRVVVAGGEATLVDEPPSNRGTLFCRQPI